MYKSWLKGVERQLKRERPDVRIEDIDPNALHEAYSNQLSPVEFVRRGGFTLKQVPSVINMDRAGCNPALPKWVIAAIVVISVLSIIAFGLIDNPSLR